MRRLVIDEIVKQAEAFKTKNDESSFQKNVELLRNIVCSIMSTVDPTLPPNVKKLDEIKFIVDCIKQLQQL